VQAQLVRLGALLLQQLAPQRGTEEAGVRSDGGWLEEMCHRVNQLLLHISILKGDTLPEDEASEFTPENGWLMVRIRSFPFGARPIFRTFAVSFRECKPLINPQ